MSISDTLQKFLSLCAQEKLSAYLVPGKFRNSLRLKRGTDGIWLPSLPSYADASDDKPLLSLVLRHYASEYSILSSGFLPFVHICNLSPSPAVMRDYKARRKDLDTVVRFLDYLFFDLTRILEEPESIHLSSLFNSKILVKDGKEFKSWSSGSTFNSLEELARKLTNRGEHFYFLHQFKDSKEPETYHEFLPLSHLVLLGKPHLILPGMIIGKI